MVSMMFLAGLAILITIGVHLERSLRPSPGEGHESTETNMVGSPDATLYAATMQMLIHADTNSWTRMYNFLTANSILMLTWATLFSSSDRGRPVLTLISLTGCILSVVWAPFGSRGRRLFRLYLNLGRQLERRLLEGTPGTSGPLLADSQTSFPRLERLCRTEHLAIWVPLTFAAMFFFLTLKSLQPVIMRLTESLCT